HAAQPAPHSPPTLPPPLEWRCFFAFLASSSAYFLRNRLFFLCLLECENCEDLRAVCVALRAVCEPTALLQNKELWIHATQSTQNCLSIPMTVRALDGALHPARRPPRSDRDAPPTTSGAVGQLHIDADSPQRGGQSTEGATQRPAVLGPGLVPGHVTA